VTSEKATEMSLGARLLVTVITGYKRFISPALPRSCRFYPTCSSYALTSVQRFGAIRGGWLAAKRIVRCNPWNPGGVDPVPEKLRNTH